MKCGYCNEEVAKEEAIKDGRYYHKSCYRKKIGKKEIEDYWLANINAGTTLQLLRKFIKDFVEIYEIDYILFVLKRVKVDKINLQYIQGLKRLLDEKKYKDEWAKIKTKKATEGMESEFDKYANKEQSVVKFKVKGRNFTKLL